MYLNAALVVNAYWCFNCISLPPTRMSLGLVMQSISPQ